MPKWLDFMEPRMTKILSHFEVKECKNHNGEAVERVNFSNEPVGQNVVSKYGFFD